MKQSINLDHGRPSESRESSRNPLTRIARTIRQSTVFRLYKYYVIDSVLIIKNAGFRELIKRRGWKVVGIVGGYYLVRDTLVYVVIPYCIARGVF